MKTLKGWEKSGMDLDKYLGEIPCEIDEYLHNNIMEVVPPNYLGWRNGLGQGGDPESSIGEIYTYTTVRFINNKYFYLGVLPEFKQ